MSKKLSPEQEKERKELYDKGLTDGQIAKELCKKYKNPNYLQPNAISYWRMKRNLKSYTKEKPKHICPDCAHFLSCYIRRPKETRTVEETKKFAKKNWFIDGEWKYEMNDIPRSKGGVIKCFCVFGCKMFTEDRRSA